MFSPNAGNTDQKISKYGHFSRRKRKGDSETAVHGAYPVVRYATKNKLNNNKF